MYIIKGQTYFRNCIIYQKLVSATISVFFTLGPFPYQSIGTQFMNHLSDELRNKYLTTKIMLCTDSASRDKYFSQLTVFSIAFMYQHSNLVYGIKLCHDKYQLYCGAMCDITIHTILPVCRLAQVLTCSSSKIFQNLMSGMMFHTFLTGKPKQYALCTLFFGSS